MSTLHPRHRDDAISLRAEYDDQERLKAAVDARAPWLGDHRIRCLVYAANAKFDAEGWVTPDVATVRPRADRRTIARLRELGFEGDNGWYTLTRETAAKQPRGRWRYTGRQMDAMRNVKHGAWQDVDPDVLADLEARLLVVRADGNVALTEVGVLECSSEEELRAEASP